MLKSERYLRWIRVYDQGFSELRDEANEYIEMAKVLATKSDGRIWNSVVDVSKLYYKASNRIMIEARRLLRKKIRLEKKYQRALRKEQRERERRGTGHP